MNIVIGLIIFAIGMFLVIKTEVILSFFGRIDFFDRYLGAEGGSRLGYKFIGLMAIFIGFLVMTNMITGFLEWMLAPILRYSIPK
jgi:hypothetical protein